MSKYTTPAEVAEYMAEVARVLKPYSKRDCEGLDIYISRVQFSFEGEPMGALVVNDFETFDVDLGGGSE